MISMVFCVPKKNSLLNENIQSLYLSKGVKKEHFNLCFLDLTKKSIKTKAIFTKYFEDKNNPFGINLHINSALSIISQSLVAFFCLKNKKTKEELGEVISKSFTIFTKKPILIKNKAVICEVKVKASKAHRLGKEYILEYILNKDCFIGEICVIVKE
ncbi:MAG: hypothetical protein PHH82_03290 [Candidatus ainarchaeum sp.]|nr:hypothetical protein [Candidatus ainarchaeum sp.]